MLLLTGCNRLVGFNSKLPIIDLILGGMFSLEGCPEYKVFFYVILNIDAKLIHATTEKY